MLGPQVVDIGADPLDQRRRRRRALLRVGLPIAGVALVVATILAIALYTDQANRKGALALSNDLLTTLEQRVASQLSAYLEPAVHALRVARATVPDGTDPARLPLAEAFGTSLLREISQIDDVGFADEDGNYLMVRRGAKGGTDVKLVRSTPRQVTWIHRNAAGEELGREDDPKDQFDPRKRPWYAGAIGSDDVFWTGVYVFFTSQAPGITVSAKSRDAEGHVRVVQIDIALHDLSEFLSVLEIGQSGRAVIMEKGGAMIAAPRGSHIIRRNGDVVTTARVDELSDDVLAHTYDRFRIDGFARHTIEVDGRRYLTATAPLATEGRDWALMMVVPEDDFVGFVASNNRNALVMSLVVVVLAGGLAALLVRQGLRADRSARLLLDRQRAIGRQSTAFATLAADASLFDPKHGEPPRALTETLADVGQARRASLWRFTQGGQLLRCEDSFERDTHGHTDGLELHREELPELFQSLLRGDEIDAADAARDRRAAGLHRVMMAPIGTSSLLAVPVRREGRIVGAVWLEDVGGVAGTKDFARAVANMVALGMSEVPLVQAGEKQLRAAPAAAPAAVRSVAADLRLRELDPATLEAEVYRGLSVLVLQLTDAAVLAHRVQDRQRSLSDEIVCALQQIAIERDIPYVKLVGQEVVAAAGFAGDARESALRVADAAVALRERCSALFEERDKPPEFRIGLDHGLAIGGMVGSEPQIFNLWGEAVRTATGMARSALPGSIQATEAAYAELRHEFLFRPRGRFFLPRFGEAQTFVLSGRL